MKKGNEIIHVDVLCPVPNERQAVLQLMALQNLETHGTKRHVFQGFAEMQCMGFFFLMFVCFTVNNIFLFISTRAQIGKFKAMKRNTAVAHADSRAALCKNCCCAGLLPDGK